eukprot:8825275-Pyramimonas_sp.AAC.1
MPLRAVGKPQVAPQGRPMVLPKRPNNETAHHTVTEWLRGGQTCLPYGSHATNLPCPSWCWPTSP